MNLKTIAALGIGFAGGWAARSLSDSPQGVGVKLLEIGMKAKERVAHWASIERERMEDMVAEARASKTTQGFAGNASKNTGSENKASMAASSVNGEA